MFNVRVWGNSYMKYNTQSTNIKSTAICSAYICIYGNTVTSAMAQECIYKNSYKILCVYVGLTMLYINMIWCELCAPTT